MRKLPFVRSAYNYDLVEASNADAVSEWPPSLTQQSMSEEADINVIVKRFGLTGVMPENVRVPQYGDFTEVTDYTSAMQAIASANSSFMSMPANVRARFDNDPQKFLQFCADKNNLDEMRAMGLAVPREIRNGEAGSGRGESGSVASEAAAEEPSDRRRAQERITGSERGTARAGGDNRSVSPQGREGA